MATEANIPTLARAVHGSNLGERLGLVKVQHTVGAGIRSQSVEVVFRQVQSKGETLYQTPRKFDTRLPVGKDIRLEVRQV